SISVNGSGLTVIMAPSLRRPWLRYVRTESPLLTLGLRIEGRGGHRRHLDRLLRGLTREVGERVVLVLGEAGQAAEVARQLDRVLVVFAAETTEVEDRVDRALELERP